jgi:hypothetical protein
MAMPTPATIPPLDLSRTDCKPDGSLVRFFAAGGDGVSTLVLLSHAVDPPLIWDRRAVATLVGLDQGCRELLPDGTAIQAERGEVLPTGEDFAILLDLAIDAGLRVP